MLEWLRKMLGTGSGGRDSGAAAPGKFAGDFAFFSRKGRTLLPQILEYLAAGEDESVLGQLAGLPAGTGNDFQLMCCQPNWRANLHKRRQQVLRAMAGASPLLHVRAAKAYEAISQRDRKHLWLDWVPGAPAWFDVYLQEALGGELYQWSDKGWASVFTARFFERMLEADGADASVLVKAALWMDPHGPHSTTFATIGESMAGLGEQAARCPEAVRAALTQAEAARRAHALATVTRWKIDMTAFAAELVDAAVDSAKTVRRMATVCRSVR